MNKITLTVLFASLWFFISHSAFSSNNLRSCVPLIDELAHTQFGIEISAAQDLAEEVFEKYGPLASDDPATIESKNKHLSLAIEVLRLLPPADSSDEILTKFSKEDLLNLFETLTNQKWFKKILDTDSKGKPTTTEDFLVRFMLEKIDEQKSWTDLAPSLKNILNQEPPNNPPKAKLQKKLKKWILFEMETARINSNLYIRTSKEFIRVLIMSYEQRIKYWNASLKQARGPAYFLKRVGMRLEIQKLNDVIKILQELSSSPAIESSDLLSGRSKRWLEWIGMVEFVQRHTWKSFAGISISLALGVIGHQAAHNLSVFWNPKQLPPIINMEIPAERRQQIIKQNEASLKQLEEEGKEPPF